MTKQLRKPSGLLAGKVSNKMNEVNEVVYDLTLESMHLRDNDSVLEIGFGNGKFFDKLFSKAKTLKVSGVDYSKDMIKIARKNNQSLTKDGKLNLQFGSSDNLPFDDNSFDKVFCINVIYFWDQPQKHLKEVYRVLKQDGQFFAAIRSKETFSHLPVAEYGFTLYNQEEWESVLKQNNFKFVEAITKKEAKDRIDSELRPHEIFCLIAEKTI